MNVVLIILFISVFNVNTYRRENEEDFIDIGVRLTGDNRDYLVADLIAEEKDIINAGHVSIISKSKKWRKGSFLCAGDVK
jgi:hypothetical protein